MTLKVLTGPLNSTRREILRMLLRNSLSQSVYSGKIVNNNNPMNVFFFFFFFVFVFLNLLTLSTLGKRFTRRHFEIFFLILFLFPEKKIDTDAPA